MIESEPFNKFIMVSSQHPDLGTIAADVAKALAEKPMPVFVRSEESPRAEVREFTIDEDGLSFKLSQAVRATLRPYLAWGFCKGCEDFAIRFRLSPLGSEEADDG